MATRDTTTELLCLVEQERNLLNDKIDDNNTPFLFTDLIKSIDYYWIGEYDNKQEYEPLIKFGFPFFLKQFYKTSTFQEVFLPLTSSTIDSLSFCHYHLYQYGKCRFIERYLELTKDDTICIKEITKNNYEFPVSSQSTLELIENRSIVDYFEVMRDYVLKEKILNQQKKRKRILKLLSKEVKVWRDEYIQYGSTPEIDDYYFQAGYIHLVTTQLYDDFDENFTFDGIPYKHILDVVQSVMGIALKHIDACTLLCNMNPKVQLYNILAIPMIPEEFFTSFAHYLNIDIEVIRKIFNLLIVSNANIDDHLRGDKDFSPPFIKIGSRFVYRSVKGCLEAPVLFLHNELKKQYPKDYFKWINEREKTFRDQLYLLFDTDRFIQIKRNVELNSKGIRTDIDAVLFDTHTKSLGLFQLKWQDKYASDLKARRSRIFNFYPKAKEWIDKMIQWQSCVDNKEILNSLNIPGSDISNVYLFVIGRYNTHFSNQEIDERAAWASWYHVVELTHKIRTNFDDPIRELFFKIKLDSPKHKKLKDNTYENYKLELNNCVFTWTYD